MSVVSPITTYFRVCDGVRIRFADTKAASNTTVLLLAPWPEPVDDATPGELADRTGTAERYVTEWLEQQAVAGFVAVNDPDADPATRRYRMPDARRPIFADADSLTYLTPLAAIAVDVLRPIEQLVQAYRTGAGVPFEVYG